MTQNRHTKPATSNKHIISLLTLIFLLALAIAIPAASALDITAPGTYTLTGDNTTLTITGTTGTYTINGAGYSITGDTTITAPAGQTLTIILNDLTLQNITSTGGNGGNGYNGDTGGSGGSGGNIYISVTDCTITSLISKGGNGGTGGYATNRPGGSGGIGGYGGNGGSVTFSATNTTIIQGVSLTSGNGGHGGNGGSTQYVVYSSANGGPGGHGGGGGSVTFSATNTTIGQDVIITAGSGSYGGNGGNGGRGGESGLNTFSGGNGGYGGNGGNGGNIYISVTDCTITSLISKGGNGGNGGRGGNGGDEGNGDRAGNGGNGGRGGTASKIQISITGSTLLNNSPISTTLGTGGNGGGGGNGGSPSGSSGSQGQRGGSGSQSGTIYNNIIYSTGPLTLTGITLYTTPTPGTNIIGGSTIAGNYWTNTAGTGYSDQQSIIGLDISPTPYGGDQYPLLKPITQPANTPDTIPTQTPDITTTTTDTYKIAQQHNLPTPLTGITYLNAKTAIIATGNAIYQITETAQAQPVTTTTDTTITQTYLSTQTAAAITTNNTILIYPYTGTTPATAIYKSQTAPIAVSQTSQTTAYITAEGQLNIHNTTTGQYLTTTTTTDTRLSANNNTNLILGHSSTQTLNIYRWDGTQIQKTTQQIPSPITKITEIPGTNNIIITTTAKTYTYTLTQTGTATLTTTSTETTPLQNTRGTTIGTYIATNTNNLYIIDQTGTTIGTYTAGASLNSVDIARLTGLWGLAGGEDTQAYFLTKTGTSGWYLEQTSQILAPITNTAIATTGYYALVAADTKLYLYSQSGTITDDTAVYWLNGIVINTNGSPYIGQITFGSDTLTTDQTGKFMVLVTPGTTYTITAGTTTTQYTATNVQYQTVAIKIQPDPYATNVDYSANWNSTTQAIDMTYTDQTGRTNSVTWKIRNTATNDIVYQQTTTSGQTLRYPLPAEQQYTNYQISMTADRTTTAGLTSPVQNTWLITPSGSNPISIPGLDDTGKNILFCAVLMIFGALFGVVHSTKGAVAVSFLAAALRYFELITIPWILIIVAATIAIIAALARGGGNN